jgi:hypothetical protein
MNNDFVAVKIGDINNSAETNAAGNETESRSKRSLILSTTDKAYQADEVVRMDITADNFTNMVGAQWTLNFDASSLEYQNITSGAIKFSKENINIEQSQKGMLTLSWNEIIGKSVSPDEVLFTLEFRAAANNTIANTLQISSDITKAEAYTHDLSELNVTLEFRNGSTSDAVFELEQNNPNPFTTSTAISFSLPQAGQANLTIYDITGKVVKTIKNVYPKGKSEVIITSDEINAQGVLFYELESNGLKATKKMIFINK